VFDGRKSLFDLVRLQEELEKVLQKKVQVLTYRSFHPLLKDRILREQIVLTWLFCVDLELIWEIAQQELTKLKKMLYKIKRLITKDEYTNERD